jgi:hypothetical protein
MKEENEWQQRINQALQGVTAVQAPNGMEERLERKLHAVQAGARARRRDSQHASSIFLLTAAAMALFAISIVLIDRGARQRGEATSHAAHSTTSGQAKVPEDALTAEAPLMHWPAAHVSLSRRTVAAPQRRFTQAPPLPLTSQERMMIALAHTPGLAAAVAVSEPITDHGLGKNTLFELDHESLPPMSSSALELSFLPSSPSQLNSSGENQ